MRIPMLVLVLLSLGCSSPRKEAERCQEQCKEMRGLARNICKRVCGDKAYGKLDKQRTEALCTDKDDLACLHLGTTAAKQKEWPVAIRTMTTCCDRDHAPCCGELGKLHLKGMLPKSSKQQAVSLMEKACTIGDAFYCASPGLHYMEQKKYELAKKLFSRGCDLEAKVSCSMLGVLYRDGDTGRPDMVMAARYFDKACKLGLKTACRAARILTDAARNAKRGKAPKPQPFAPKKKP